MINEQMIYIGMTVMAVACLFLIYQNYQMRMAHALDISRINKTIKDMENSSRGNNLLPSTNSQPDMVEEFNSTNENNPPSDIDNTYNKLKNEYDNYINTDIEQIESHSEGNNDDVELDEALKQKIEKLSQEENYLNQDYDGNQEEQLFNTEVNQESTLTDTQDSLENTENNNNDSETINEPENIDNTENLTNLNTLESDELIDNTENLLDSNDISEVNENKNETNIEHIELNEETNELSQDLELDNNFKVDEIGSDLNIDEMESVDIGDNLEEISSEQLNDDNTESLSDKLNSSEEYLSNLTLKELQTLAKENNVKIKGRKSELIERLMSKN